MRIEKISYSQSRESVNSIGLKKWDKVGVEAELRDGDIYEECFTELKKEVDGFYNSINPPSNSIKDLGVYENFVAETQVEKPIRDTVDNIIAAINSSKNLVTLKWLEPTGENAMNERIMNAYNEKLKSFQ